MMIVLFGATGMAGSRIAAEALARGHEVTGVSRDGAAPVEDERFIPLQADAADTGKVAELAAAHDVVASAIAPPRDGGDPRERFAVTCDGFLRGVRASGMDRLVIVGGAGSLQVSPGWRLMDTPDFPEEAKGEALAQDDLLSWLRTLEDLDWTYVSPAAMFGPGPRTGEFRIGGDELLTDPEGQSAISAEDYAIAFVDALESYGFSRTRISVAY